MDVMPETMLGYCLWLTNRGGAPAFYPLLFCWSLAQWLLCTVPDQEEPCLP